MEARHPTRVSLTSILSFFSTQSCQQAGTPKGKWKQIFTCPHAASLINITEHFTNRSFRNMLKRWIPLVALPNSHTEMLFSASLYTQKK